MKMYLRYLLLLVLALTFFSGGVYADGHDVASSSEEDSVIIFRFIPKDLMFYDSKKLGFREPLSVPLTL